MYLIIVLRRAVAFEKLCVHEFLKHQLEYRHVYVENSSEAYWHCAPPSNISEVPNLRTLELNVGIPTALRLGWRHVATFNSDFEHELEGKKLTKKLKIFNCRSRR